MFCTKQPKINILSSFLKSLIRNVQSSLINLVLYFNWYFKQIIFSADMTKTIRILTCWSPFIWEKLVTMWLESNFIIRQNLVFWQIWLNFWLSFWQFLLEVLLELPDHAVQSKLPAEIAKKLAKDLAEIAKKIKLCLITKLFSSGTVLRYPYLVTDPLAFGANKN